ncbi:hypothetical protein GQ457_07G000610 [Hibiscus cannabinus]
MRLHEVLVWDEILCSCGYWDVQCKPWFSWCLRKLIKLRSVVQTLPSDSLRMSKTFFNYIKTINSTLCMDVYESRNHLFAKCAYSKQVLGAILCLCEINRDVMDWESEVQWFSTRLKGKSLMVVICKLALGLYVYRIWEERNRRKFRNVSRDCIKEAACIHIQCRNTRMNDVSRSCIAWGIP